MTVTPDGLSFGGGKHAKPEPPPIPAISGHLPLFIRPDGADTATGIQPDSRIVAGSSGDADLVLPGMAPQHAVFYVLAGEWAVASFTPGHSWLVTGDGDEPLFGPRVLHRGDRIKLGTVTFTIDTAA